MDAPPGLTPGMPRPSARRIVGAGWRRSGDPSLRGRGREQGRGRQAFLLKAGHGAGHARGHLGGDGREGDAEVGQFVGRARDYERLLALPALRERYLRYVGDIAEKWLDWDRLGPMVDRYRALIEADVGRDTRKLTTTDAFRGAFGAASDSTPATLRGFTTRRRSALMEHPAVLAARRR